MKTLAVNLRKYLKLMAVFTKINILQAMEYRIDFWSAILPAGFYFFAYILFVSAIFGHVPKISGWTLEEILVIFAGSQIFYYFSWFLFRNALGNFSDSVNTGYFDFEAKLPISTRFIVSFRDQAINMFLPVLLAIFTFSYAIRNIQINYTDWLLFITLSISGMFILYNIFFILACFSFWIIESSDLTDLFDELLSFGRYPQAIFPRGVALVLLTIIPVLTAVYVPASALLRKLDWKLAVLSLLIATASHILSDKVWQAGLRHYSSASS